MLKRFRYRAYVTHPDQVTAVNKTFGCARVVFNDVVRAREDAHRAGQSFVKTGDLSKSLITQAKLTPEREWNAATNLLVAAGHAETLNACGGDIRLALASAGSRETGTPHTAAA